MENENVHIDIQLLTRSLAGEITTEEQQQVEKWLADSKANRNEYASLRKTWDSLGQTHPGRAIDIDAEWEHLQGMLKVEGSKSRVVTFRTFLRVAAVIAILVGLGVVGLLSFRGNTFRTEMAETEVILLPDGSRVTLNAGSKLSYGRNYGKGSRQVSLYGEAYFEVESDSLRPFVIHAGEAAIEVLGTAFNVRAYQASEKIEVTVTEGKVSVYERKQQEKRVIATAGEKAEYFREASVVKKTRNTDRNFLAWKTRTLVFEDDRLDQVVRVISEAYHRQVEVKSEPLRTCRLTTRFEDKDLDTVLKVLESTFDIQIEKTDGTIYLKGAGCE